MGKNRFKKGRRKRPDPNIFLLQNTPFGNVIFTKERYNNHLQYHPELQSPEFISKVKTSIYNPEKVFFSSRYPINTNLIIYNKIEKSYNPINPMYNARYVKIVIVRKRNPRKVATAFERDIIKEKKMFYPNKYGRYV